MAIFKRKPSTEKFVEAAQYFKDGPIVAGVCGDADCELMSADHVHTAHERQAVELTDGDWILPEPDGQGFYPVKADVFAERYEPADSAEKTLHNSDISGAKVNVPDIKVVGNGDLFQLLCKASSQREGWMKSSKAMEIDGVGCVVQVTTQQKNPDGSYAVAEAVTFVPGATITTDINGGRKLI